MGGYNYNFTSISTGYGDETPRQTDHVRLSPLLCSGSCTFLPYEHKRTIGLGIQSISKLHRKIAFSFKSLFLQVVTKIKKVIAYLKKSI